MVSLVPPTKRRRRRWSPSSRLSFASSTQQDSSHDHDEGEDSNDPDDDVSSLQVAPLSSFQGRRRSSFSSATARRYHQTAVERSDSESSDSRQDDDDNGNVSSSSSSIRTLSTTTRNSRWPSTQDTQRRQVSSRTVLHEKDPNVVRDKTTAKEDDDDGVGHRCRKRPAPSTWTAPADNNKPSKMPRRTRDYSGLRRLRSHPSTATFQVASGNHPLFFGLVEGLVPKSKSSDYHRDVFLQGRLEALPLQGRLLELPGPVLAGRWTAQLVQTTDGTPTALSGVLRDRMTHLQPARLSLRHTSRHNQGPLSVVPEARSRAATTTVSVVDPSQSRVHGLRSQLGPHQDDSKYEIGSLSMVAFEGFLSSSEAAQQAAEISERLLQQNREVLAAKVAKSNVHSKEALEGLLVVSGSSSTHRRSESSPVAAAGVSFLARLQCDDRYKLLLQHDAQGHVVAMDVSFDPSVGVVSSPSSCSSTTTRRREDALIPNPVSVGRLTEKRLLRHTQRAATSTASETTSGLLIPPASRTSDDDDDDVSDLVPRQLTRGNHWNSQDKTQQTRPVAAKRTDLTAAKSKTDLTSFVATKKSVPNAMSTMSETPTRGNLAPSSSHGNVVTTHRGQKAKAAAKPVPPPVDEPTPVDGASLPLVTPAPDASQRDEVSNSSRSMKQTRTPFLSKLERVRSETESETSTDYVFDRELMTKRASENKGLDVQRLVSSQSAEYWDSSSDEASSDAGYMFDTCSSRFPSSRHQVYLQNEKSSGFFDTDDEESLECEVSQEEQDAPYAHANPFRTMRRVFRATRKRKSSNHFDTDEESVEQDTFEPNERSPSSRSSTDYIFDSATKASSRKLSTADQESFDDDSYDDVVCALCDSGESPDEDPIVLCDGPKNDLSCNFAVHKSCYSITENLDDLDHWHCQSCLLVMKNTTRRRAEGSVRRETLGHGARDTNTDESILNGFDDDGEANVDLMEYDLPVPTPNEIVEYSPEKSRWPSIHDVFYGMHDEESHRECNSLDIANVNLDDLTTNSSSGSVGSSSSNDEELAQAFRWPSIHDVFYGVHDEQEHPECSAEDLANLNLDDMNIGSDDESICTSRSGCEEEFQVSRWPCMHDVFYGVHDEQDHQECSPEELMGIDLEDLTIGPYDDGASDNTSLSLVRPGLTKRYCSVLSGSPLLKLFWVLFFFVMLPSAKVSQHRLGNSNLSARSTRIDGQPQIASFLVLTAESNMLPSQSHQGSSFSSISERFPEVFAEESTSFLQNWWDWIY